MKINKEILDHLDVLYGSEIVKQVESDLIRIFLQYSKSIPIPSQKEWFNHKDVFLITYADIIRKEGESSLKTLNSFLIKWVSEFINTVHILPFFPYSSDDGFSVIDFKSVQREFGTWEDVTKIGTRFHLMFDLVINHISSQSTWFQGFLRGSKKYQSYFIKNNSDDEIKNVFRPRETPLITFFNTHEGKQGVWTTFSEDQIDLNFKNPQVLLEFVDTMLFYISKGADYFRFDAIAYIWKEKKTNCLHLPQVHTIVQLFRSILNQVAPWVKIITETNVPHPENISYFGNGENEAQLVYNFTLPPLTLYSFHVGNAESLTAWAATLIYPSKKSTFFNFLASHDGVGVIPVKNIIDNESLDTMAERIKQLGGTVSYRTDATKETKSPYEFNINYLDALGIPEIHDEPYQLIGKRFLATQAIMLAMKGIPGIYFHSLFGSRNWLEGVKRTQKARTINREKLQIKYLEAELLKSNSLRNIIFSGYKNLLCVRTSCSAFHPNGKQIVLNLHKSLFSIIRISPDGREVVLCIHNVKNEIIDVSLDLTYFEYFSCSYLQDLLSGKSYLMGKRSIELNIPAFGVLWLKGITA